MNVILFDDESQKTLLPLTHTRPVADIRIGILKISEKWDLMLNTKCSFLTSGYLSECFPLVSTNDNLLINGSVLPDVNLIAAIRSLAPGSQLKQGEVVLAMRIQGDPGTLTAPAEFNAAIITEYSSPIHKIRFPWDIFSGNEKALTADFELLCKGRKSQAISQSNTVFHPEKVFIEEGAKVECAVLNASSGYIYIGKDAEVMEGALIRGPFSLGEHSQVKMGSKIYGATTIGPHCKVAGEVSNSVIFGYSNKAHEGFLGNSVLGEWCNLGADTNNSNLKNNYSKVKVWNYAFDDYINTGLQFCGLMMGDHSKCSINTMFNTGTVVGVSANIYGNGFPPKFVPSFSWGGSEGFATYRIEDAIEVATRVYERRGIIFGEKEQKLLRNLFDSTTKYRSW